MLTNKALFSEIEIAEKIREGLKSEYEKAVLKMSILQVKLLHDIRTNMTTMMKFYKIPLVEPQVKTDIAPSNQ